jgi:hypothetical protein
MAKKTRRMRREEGVRDIEAPRVPNSLTTAPTAGPRPSSVGAPPRIAAPLAPPRATRAGRPTVETAARLGEGELTREFSHVRRDLVKISILAVALITLLVVLTFVLPQVLG